MWQLKPLVQYGLAHVPGGEHLNYGLQVAMGHYSPTTVRQYATGLMARFAILPTLRKMAGLSVVEVGTGWHGVSALALSLYGAGPIYTFDHVRHLRYRRMHEAVEQLRLSADKLVETTPIPQSVLLDRLDSLKAAPDLETLLERAHIIYRAPADAAVTGLPDGSVDMVFSHGVLGCMPLEALHRLTEETRRILKPGGLAVHFIDMEDPFANSRNGLSAMNFLRYSPRWWDFFVQNKVCSNNRLREKEFVEFFRSHGAAVRLLDHVIRPKDVEAVRAMKVHPRFGGMTPEELAVCRSTMVFSFESRE